MRGETSYSLLNIYNWCMVICFIRMKCLATVAHFFDLFFLQYVLLLSCLKWSAFCACLTQWTWLCVYPPYMHKLLLDYCDDLDLWPDPFRMRCIGSAALHMCMVAEGTLDAHFTYGIHIWDMAAGYLVVEEAGGIVIDTGGSWFCHWSYLHSPACILKTNVDFWPSSLKDKNVWLDYALSWLFL